MSRNNAQAPGAGATVFVGTDAAATKLKKVRSRPGMADSSPPADGREVLPGSFIAQEVLVLLDYPHRFRISRLHPTTSLAAV